MTPQALSPMGSELPDHPSSISALADLSLDELRFLRSCDRRWFELSPAKASAIIRAARRLVLELVNENGDPAMQDDDTVGRQVEHHYG